MPVIPLYCVSQESHTRYRLHKRITMHEFYEPHLHKIVGACACLVGR